MNVAVLSEPRADRDLNPVPAEPQEHLEMAKQMGWDMAEPGGSKPPATQQSEKTKQERGEAGQAVWETAPGRFAAWVPESKSLWIHSKLRMLQTHGATLIGEALAAQEESEKAQAVSTGGLPWPEAAAGCEVCACILHGRRRQVLSVHSKG